jgi:hypothetical protein
MGDAKKGIINYANTIINGLGLSAKEKAKLKKEAGKGDYTELTNIINGKKKKSNKELADLQKIIDKDNKALSKLNNKTDKAQISKLNTEISQTRNKQKAIQNEAWKSYGENYKGLVSSINKTSLLSDIQESQNSAKETKNTFKDIAKNILQKAQDGIDAGFKENSLKIEGLKTDFSGLDDKEYDKKANNLKEQNKELALELSKYNKKTKNNMFTQLDNGYNQAKNTLLKNNPNDKKGLLELENSYKEAKLKLKSDMVQIQNDIKSNATSILDNQKSQYETTIKVSPLKDSKSKFNKEDFANEIEKADQQAKAAENINDYKSSKEQLNKKIELEENYYALLDKLHNEYIYKANEAKKKNKVDEIKYWTDKANDVIGEEKTNSGNKHNKAIVFD